MYYIYFFLTVTFTCLVLRMKKKGEKAYEFNESETKITKTVSMKDLFPKVGKDLKPNSILRYRGYYFIFSQNT